LGALTVAAGVETVGAGVVLIVVVPRVGTGGITIRDASVDFLAAGFFAVDFLAAGFLAEDFLAEDFLAEVFLATAFFATDFLAAGFFATDFLAPDFLATDFFFVATLTPSNLEVSLTSPAESLLSPG
jgi:hypothetical protein